MIYVYFFIKCVVRLSENSVRFDKSYGNWLPDGSEIWHVCLAHNHFVGCVMRRLTFSSSKSQKKKKKNQLQKKLLGLLFKYSSFMYSICDPAFCKI